MDPKSHILNAAQGIFARHGFRQTSMAMVAAEAQLSRQALYHHFASKEALFAALVSTMHEAALTAVQAASAKPSAVASDAVFAVMMAYHESLVARLSGSPFVAELIEESGRQCGPAVAAYGRRFEKELEALCARLVRDGRLKLRAGYSVRDVVEMVVVAARGVKSAHAGESEARYARALSRMVGVICAGVTAAKAAPAKSVQRLGSGRRRVSR
ncbi:MAG: TetR/AcrR family transcriptional regulator [Alphaproteobacteria bacterium]|nr:TetR/AcrR family transcriptional regulator [Alphaproteobacteria bacterium]